MTMTVSFKGNRVVIGGPATSKLLVLASRLEGMKKWLTTGGFSFENTPLNLDRFAQAFPDVPLEVPKGSGMFDGYAATAKPRGTYVPKTDPFPFQWKALVASAHMRPPDKVADTFPFDVNKALSGPPPEAYAILGEMGTGKTKMLIDTAGALWCLGLIDAMLIIAPKGVHAQWIEEQLPEHMGPACPWAGAIINNKKKLPPAWPTDKLAVLAVNIDYPRTKHGNVNCQEFIRTFKGRVLIIVDESHNIKTLTAQRTEAIIGLGTACAYRRIATGTPISKNLIDAFAQYYFLDRNILKMEYVTSFRAEYCIMGGFEMQDVVGHKNVEQFWDRVAPFTFRITKKEADLDLPEKLYERVPFEMTPQQKDHYLQMKEEMITAMANGTLVGVKNAVSQLVKLQQIACGFLFKKGDPKKGIADELQQLPNARMDALMNVLNQRSGKAVIWARFNEDITGMMRVFGKTALDYYGATSDNDREIAKRRFLDQKDPVRYLVANPASGGSGLNLQGECATVIYYSNSFDAIDRWQSEDRVHRIGALHNITYFDLVARKTLDLKILRNLQGKKSISDLAFDNIRQMLEEPDEVTQEGVVTDAIGELFRGLGR